MTLLVTGILLAGCGTEDGGSSQAATPAESKPGCAPVTERIVMDQEFTPYANQRGGKFPEVPLELRAPADLPNGAPDELEGGRRAVATVGFDSGTSVYYSNSKLAPSVTRPLALARGVLILDSFPPGQISLPEDMRMSFPGRVVDVEVGEFDAVISWDDPNSRGTRAHRVTWNDRSSDFVLIGDLPAAELLTVARGMVCN